MNTLGFIILTTALSFAVIFISFYASHLNRQLKRLNGHLSAYKQNLENHRRVHAILASERDAKENLATELQTRNAELKQDISRLQGEIEAVHLRYKPKRGKGGKFVSKATNATVETEVGKSNLRPISTLKPTEAIRVNNEAERDAILELMGKEGWKWKTGVPATAYMPSVTFPHLLSNNYIRIEGISWGEIEPHIALGDTILPASDFLPTIEPVEQKETRDWSKPQAFPEEYEVPLATRVIALENGSYPNEVCVSGDNGTVVYSYAKGGAKVIFDGRDSKMGSGWFMKSHELAPLNPTNHPEHPQFKGEK